MAKRIPNGAYKTEKSALQAAKRSVPYQNVSIYKTYAGYGWTVVGSAHEQDVLAGKCPEDECIVWEQATVRFGYGVACI